MRIHILERSQLLGPPPPEAFEFFCDPLNLEAITPAWLAFRVTTPSPIEMAAGTLLDYRLRLHGIPVRWRTRIEEWEPGVRFVDRQLKGPYRLWHHAHTFEPAGDGTLMTDVVRYSLPLGPVGELAGWALVRRDLERIFDYRREAVAECLGE